MNIFDKLKLPFAKKVKQVPVSWVEEGPEHYYVIHWNHFFLKIPYIKT